MFKEKLASTEAVKCYDDVLKSIDDLNEDHAKALLKQVYARLDIVQMEMANIKVNNALRILYLDLQN